MGQDDWYRRKSWTDADRSEFHQRLKRSRTMGNVAQYVRIQAVYLADVGEMQGAIELLDQLFADFPEKSQLASAHLQKAECMVALGEFDEAVKEYRAALWAEKQFPSVRTRVWLKFPWFVVMHGMTELYPEACRFLDWGEGKPTFPVDEYKLATIEAFMAADRGDADVARGRARAALVSAAKQHSGFRYHAKLGLVTQEEPHVRQRLEELAGL
jgi:tetratricopeptide (TPR) repeat protein